MSTDDPVLNSMADELYTALKQRGADTKNPPDGAPPPDRPFAEYQKRGGTQYTDKNEFISALVENVKAR